MHKFRQFRNTCLCPHDILKQRNFAEEIYEAFSFFPDLPVPLETSASSLKSMSRGLKGHSEVKTLGLKTAHYMKKSSLYFKNGNLNEFDS